MSRVISHGHTHRHGHRHRRDKMWRLILLCCVSGALSTSYPYINRCVTDDEECILKSSNAALPYFLRGIPELDIAPMDPLYIPKISNNNAGLQLTFTDNNVTGLSSCAVTHMKSELLTKSTHTVTIKCPEIVVAGLYTISGQLIIFPIQGDGKFKITLRDAVIKVTTKLTTETGKDGKPHWKIIDWHHSFKVNKDARFDFENLFNGNKVIAEPIVEYINENWKDVLDEAAPPIHTAIIQVVVDDIKKLYKHLPKEDLYLI